MNIIQKQASDFYQGNAYAYRASDYKPFVDKVKLLLYDYRKISHKIEFVDTIMNQMKQEYDEHIPVCKNPTDCGKNKFYENALFFLQEEVEDLEQQLPATEFSRIQKQETSAALDALVADLNSLKAGQQITYDDLMQEFKDLRDFLYLDKDNFTQLILGKITEMAAGGIVTETVSKSLLDVVREHYPTLLNFKF